MIKCYISSEEFYPVHAIEVYEDGPRYRNSSKTEWLELDEEFVNQYNKIEVEWELMQRNLSNILKDQEKLK